MKTDQKKSKSGLVFILLVFSAVIGSFLYILQSQKGQGLNRFKDMGGDFTLTDHNGESYSLYDNNEKIKLLFFGYTHCPDACPAMLAKLNGVFIRMGKTSERVEILFISVDPERDDAARLKEYLGYFNMPVTGLTGDAQTIAGVASRYQATYEKTDSGSAAGYFVDHSTNLYLLDKKGEIRYIFKHGDSIKMMARITGLLAAKKE